MSTLSVDVRHCSHVENRWGSINKMDVDSSPQFGAGSDYDSSRVSHTDRDGPTDTSHMTPSGPTIPRTGAEISYGGPWTPRSEFPVLSSARNKDKTGPFPYQCLRTFTPHKVVCRPRSFIMHLSTHFILLSLLASALA
jgi:hypothetical protein